MKSFIAVGALFAAAATAQSITDIPSCALGCIATAVGKYCTSVTDYKCACTNAAKINTDAAPCVQSSCTSTADQQKVVTVLEGICANAGFPITVSVPGSSSSAAPASSSAAASTPASSAAVTSAASSAASSAAASSAAGSASGSACSASTTYTTVTVKATSPASSPSAGISSYSAGSNATVTTALPTQYTGAASANGVTFGAAGVLGLLAYLL